MTSTLTKKLNGVLWSDSDGLVHNTEGPAVIWGDGKLWWKIHGIRIWSAEAFQEATGHSDEKMAELLMTYGEIK